MNSLSQDIHPVLQGSNTGWGARLVRRRLFALLEALPRGRLVIEDADGRRAFGRTDTHSDLEACIQVRDTAFYEAIARAGSIGAAESWVRGEWHSADLLRVMRLMAANIDALNRLDDRGSIATRTLLRLLHALRWNSPGGARRNIGAHYDLGNALFEHILDPTMMYSAALFPHPDASLEEASICKLERICRRLELAPRDHLLEIGTGWGGLALHAARHYGCRVTTTTISREQHACAKRRVEEAGLAGQVEVLLSDYRELGGRYDKLVSIEMVEAVGHRFLPRYFATCSRLLRPHGLMLLQSILIPDQRYARALRNVDFIQRHIFPGGFLPCAGEILRQVGARTDMQLVDTLDMTRHYAATLAAWRNRLQENAAQIRALGYGEDFLRLWDFYFAYCEGGFRERAIGTAQFLFAKPQWREAGGP